MQQQEYKMSTEEIERRWLIEQQEKKKTVLDRCPFLYPEFEILDKKQPNQDEHLTLIRGQSGPIAS